MNRQKAEQELLDGLEAISPGCSDVARYKERFSKMDDQAFQQFIERLKTGKETVQLTVPPGEESKRLSIERNKEIADKWGHSFYHRLYMPSDNGTPRYLTPLEYLVVSLPIRVASQRIAKKMSIPKTQRVINSLTGQPTGDSKGAGFSFPELRLCMSMGLEKSSVELMKYRGGDQRGHAALMASLSRSGKASQEVLEHFASGVESTTTLYTYLTSAHLKNTLR